MSEPSLEYNLGTLGFFDAVKMDLLAYKDERTLFCLSFSNPKNKRLKPVHINLENAAFTQFHELLISAEVQINKLLTSQKMSALALPETEIQFRSNLGDVRYNSCILGVSVLVAKDMIGCLQVFAVDTKSRADGFSVIFDDNEFTKLKKIVNETFYSVFKPKQVENSSPPRQGFPDVADKKFVGFSADGKIETLDVRDIGEAGAALKQIPLFRRRIALRKHDIETKIRRLRSDHSMGRGRQISKIPGGGWFGTIIRLFQTVERDSQKLNLIAQIEPLENQKRLLEDSLSTLSSYEYRLKRIMQGKDKC